MADQRLNIWLRVREAGADAFRRVDAGLRSLVTRARTGKLSLDDLSVAWNAVSKVAAAAAAAVTAFTVGLAKLAERGGEVVNVKRAFARVAGDTTAALGKLRETTRGLVSDYDLLVGFNRAVTLGSAENIEQFGELTRTALTLGRALGVDAAFAIESLNLGIGRQSRLILDNLGLIVSVEQANRKYAEAIGTTVDALDDAQKREAFRIAALEAARAKIEQLGGIELTAADNVTRLTVGFKNFRDEISELVARSPGVGRFFETLIAGLNKAGVALTNLLDPRGEARRIREFEEELAAELGRLGELPLEQLEQRRTELLRRRFELEPTARAAGAIVPGLGAIDTREIAARVEYLRNLVSEADAKLQRDLTVRMGTQGQMGLLTEKTREDITAQAEAAREALAVEEERLRTARLLEAAHSRISQLLGDIPEAPSMAELERQLAEESARLAGAGPDLTERIRRPALAGAGYGLPDIEVFIPQAAARLRRGGAEAARQFLAAEGFGEEEITRAMGLIGDLLRETEETAEQMDTVWGDIMQGLVEQMVVGGDFLVSAFAGVIRAMQEQISGVFGGGFLGGIVSGFAGGLLTTLAKGITGRDRSTAPVPVTVTNRVKLDRSDEKDPVVIVQITDPATGRVLEEFVVEANRLQNRGGTMRLPRPFPLP